MQCLVVIALCNNDTSYSTLYDDLQGGFVSCVINDLSKEDNHNHAYIVYMAPTYTGITLVIVTKNYFMHSNVQLTIKCIYVNYLVFFPLILTAKL